MENNVYNTRTLVRWLRWLGLTCLLLAGMINVSSAAVNTNSGSGLNPTYPDLATAVTALNAATITSPVTITLTANETAPAGGYSITAQGSATNTIVIDGAGFTITANGALTAGALNDAIIKLVGADFVTIQNFIMQENAANTTTAAATNNMTEWGVALLYASTTNGASSNTIQGNTISLNRTYQNSFGIYSNSTHSATAVTTVASATGVTGANDSLRVYSNNISNVNNGITYVGPTAAADQADYVDIGGGSGQGNTLTNYGNTGTFSGYANVSGTVNGILVRNVRNFNISYNSITSSSTTGALTSSGTLRGIYVVSASNAPTGTNTQTITNNGISLVTGVATGALDGIRIEATTGNATTSLTVNNNNFSAWDYNVASASGTVTFIGSLAVDLNTTINNNTFTNLNINTTGSVTFITNSITVSATGSQTIQANSIVTGFNKGGAGGTITFCTSSSFSTAGATILHRNNNFSNITVTGATTIAGWASSDGGSANKTYQNNTFSNITGGTSSVTIMSINFGGNAGGNGNVIQGNTISNITGQSSVTGISVGSSATIASVFSNTITNLTSTGTGGTVIGITSGTPTVSIYSNTIGTLATSGASSTATGITCSSSTSSTIRHNKVYDVSASAAGGSVFGITVSAGTTSNIYNNIVGDLRAPAANAANPVIGLNITGGTTVNAFYNTVYLNASSSGALFGSSALSVSTTPTFTLRNNLLVNNSSTTGTGLAVAYRRSSTTLTSYAAASNNNDFVASTIYYDGTTAYAFPAYQTLVSTRDNASINWAPVFLSTTGSNANFLHIDTSVLTMLESGAVNITTPAITDDFDANVRQGNVGYAGTGTAPDIGADEFGGTRPTNCSGAPTAGTATITPTFRCASGTALLSVNDPNLSLGVTVQWYESTTSGTWAPLGTQVPGGNATSVTTPAYTSDRYFVASFKCSFTGDSTLSNEVHLTVYPAASISVSPTSATYCSGTAALPLTASGGVTYSWSPATGLNATTGATVNANPTVSTVYTVTGTNANGCSATATSSISFSPNLTSLTATATPSSICNGANSQLQATAVTPPTGTYTMSTITYAPIAGSGASLTSGDDAVSAAVTIPFSFNFFGTAYTSLVAYTNGFIQLGTSSGSTSVYGASIPSAAAPNNIIAGVWNDLLISSPALISSFVSGSAPNRILVVSYSNCAFYNSGVVTGNTNWQIQLYEGSNNIEIHIGEVTGTSSTSTTKTLGIENSTGTSGYSPAGRNLAAWTVATGTPEAYRFAPNVIGVSSYSWSPSTFLNNPAISNPLATAVTASTTYTVTATATNGCSLTATASVTAGAAMVAAPTATPSTICSNQSTSLDAGVSGGGAPYTYDWSDGVTTIGTSSPLVVTPAGTTTFTVTVTDACLSTTTGTVTVTVNPAPSVSVSPTSGAYCSSAVAITASGTATTYAWSPAAGLNVTTGTSVNATPSVNTVYTVTGTAANGCTTTATTTINKGIQIQTVTPSATPSTVCNLGTSNLNVTATAALPFVRITEVTLYDQGTGQTSPYPGFITSTGALDFVEITNTSIVAADISGWTYADYSSASTTANHSYTFGSGTIIPANSVLVLHLGSGTDIPASRYYNTGGTSNFYSSGGLVCYVLKNGSTVVDAVATNGATFAAGTGVTGADWSGSASALSGNAGSSRTATTDSNTGADWTTASSHTQTIGIFDAGYINPNNGTITGYSWSPSTFLNNTAIQTPTASAMTSTTTYTVTVTEALGCTASGTVTVTVGDPLVVSASSTPASVCLGSTASLSASASGGGAPYSYDWSDGTGSIGTTSPLTITPSASGTYTVTVTDFCGSSQTATVSITVNSVPSISVTNSNPNVCAPSTTSTLTASGTSDTYSWAPVTGLNVTTGTTVVSTPSATTVYTVTGTTTATGCTSTATTTVVLGVSFLTSTATATPATVCVGGSSQLQANATLPACATYYTIASGTFGLLPTTGFTALPGDDDGDLATGVALPFSFNFFGTTQSTINFSSNGYVYFGTPNGGSILSAGVTNGISIFSADMLPAAGQVSYGTVGVSPNQVFVIDYNAMPEFSGGGTHTGQIQIFQNGRIEIHVASATSSTRTKTLGLRNAAGTDNAIPAGRGSSTWTVSTPEAWVFTQCFTASISGYSWSPTTDLDNPTIANPLASLVSANTVYTVTITNTSGCTTTATASVTVDPLVVSAIAVPSPACAGSTASLTAVVTGGGAPYTYDWDDGSGSIGTTSPLTITPSAGTTVYTVTVSDFCGATQSSTVSLLVNAPPTVSITNATPSLCPPLTSSVLTASGADTYVWSPSTGLNATTGATVTSTPSTTTVYTVTGTSTSTGCTSTATTTVTKGANFLTSSASATPNSVCAPGTSQLDATATLLSCSGYYGVASTTYALQPTTGFTTVTGLTDDNSVGPFTIPFSFNFFGTAQTSFYVGSNGYITFGAGSADRFSQVFPSATAPNDIIALCYADLLPSSGGTVSYGVTGVSPNRIFVIDWTNTPFYNLGSPTGGLSGQIQLFESGGVQIHVTSIDHGVSTSLNGLGLENSAGTDGTAPAGRNGGTSAYNVAANEAWIFAQCSPATITGYSWTPSADLSNPAISNPVATNILGTTTYTVTITNSTGCTVTATTTVTVAPLSVAASSSAASLCSGSPATLTATVTGGGSPYTYDWSDGTSSIGTSNPLTVNPTSSATYTVTVTDNCGGTASATVAVSVLPSPTVGLTSSVPGICSPGPSVTLTASGATTYSWNGVLDPTVYTQTVSFNVASQPVETNVTPGNIVASATLPALPAGAVVSSYTLTYNGINALTNSFGSDVNLGFSGAVTAAAVSGIGAPSAAGVFNYVQTFTSGVNTAGGTVNLLYWDVVDDNAGSDESTFPLGTGVASLVISYQIPSSGNTLVVTPSATTTYTVTGTNGSGCTNTATVTVVIPPGSTTTATATPAFICAGGTSQLNAVATYPPPTAPTYCAVTNLGGSCVSLVTLNTLNSVNPPGCSASGFYNFNAPVGANTTTLMPGSSYTMTVSTSGTAIVSVFIDFDRNGVYDASEWVQPYTSATTGTVTINVPSGASIGQTGMRVRSRLNGNQNDATTACLVGMGSGSTEDYVVTIGVPVSGSFTYSWSPATGLNNPAIQNPVATLASTSTYTVTASDIYGCTSTATVTVSVDPLVVSASASATTICQGISTTLTGVATGGGQPYTYDWSDGTSSVGTTAAITVSPSTTTTYTFTVTDNCATVLSATPITITVNPAPGVSVTPSTALYCAPTPVALTATSGTGGTTFAWSPATGLNVTTGANVNATPSAAITYTVTATGTNGCTSTATASITIGTPITVDATADTTEGCSPFGTILHGCVNPAFNTYNIDSTAATYSPSGTPGVVHGAGIDDAGATVNLPFSFNFYGTSYTTASVSSNGYILFGGTVASSTTVNGNLAMPNTATNNNSIALTGCDLHTRTTGSVDTFTVGVAPTRKFVVRYNDMRFFSDATTSLVSGEIVLNEGSGVIEIVVGTVNAGTDTRTRTLGIENAAGTAAMTAPGKNNDTWSVSTPITYRFTPAARTCNNAGITFAWTPSGNLNSGAISDPTVTGLTASTLYTLTATNASGCAAQDTITLVVHAQAPTPTITPSGPLSFCPGGSVDLTSSNNTFPNNWSTSETTQTITVSTTQVVTLIASDAYCPSAPVSVNVVRYDTIQPLISVAGGGATICTGTRDLIADGAPQYTSWLWSTTETTQIITISAPGTYYLTATDLHGCLTHNEQTFTAGVAPPAPVITASTGLTVCNGTEITMTSNIDPVIGSLSWSPTSQTTAVITNTFSPPGVYDFFVTYDSLGCTSESNHLVITVNPTPDVFTFLPADSACIGDVITLSGSGLLNVSAISFNGTPATSFTIVDDFTITVTVPAGATTGSLTLTDGSTGCVGVSPVFTIKVICSATLTVKAYLQGYYDASTSTMRPVWTNHLRTDLGNGNMGSPVGTEADLVMVELYDASNTLAYSDSMMLDINGNGSVSFPSATNGNSYYIMIKHRCHIGTRSAGLVLMGASTSYDFTTASTQVDEIGSASYGGPMMVEVEPNVWAFFAGDINQDGFIGGDDVGPVDNDNLAGLTAFDSGYMTNDINGDGFLGGDDVGIVDNNNLSGVFYLYP